MAGKLLPGRAPMPTNRTPLDASGRLEPPWVNYLGYVEKSVFALSKLSTVANVPAVTFVDLTGASTTAQIATAVNELKARVNDLRTALINSGMMDP